MDIRERLNQIVQAHAQHVQLLQQTQANIIRLEGAMEMLKELVATEDTSASITDNVVPINRKQRRARRTKAQMQASAEQHESEAPPA